ncbi:MAG: hypothetical protein JSV98_10705 [candidate division WOR-3 bacterium]|nr:MAG: hypothetical protein JSV98_10705 [candidate division WOR-3 bacterium]
MNRLKTYVSDMQDRANCNEKLLFFGKRSRAKGLGYWCFPPSQPSPKNYSI